jgi:hypothetical protein
MSGAAKLKTDNAEILRIRGQLRNMNAQVRRLNEQMSLVRGGGMPKEEKRKRMDALKRQRNGVIKRIKGLTSSL